MRAPIAVGAVSGIAVLCLLMVAGGSRLPAVDDGLPAGSTAPAASAPASGKADRIETATLNPDAPLERAPAREPLGAIGWTRPVVPPAKWKGTLLHQPVAGSAGQVEAMGYRIAIAGVDGPGIDETCDWQGRNWDCGMRARTAFRLFLRGRAVRCVVPPEPDRDLIAASCAVGREDAGAWLVEQGWARAAEGGPYADAAEQARNGRRGLFGPPPAGTN